MSVMVKYSSELKHHGIKGQHWGVQNGPPYPLSSNISDGKKLRTFKTRTSVYGYDKQDKYINDRHRIKKGTKMYRTTTSATEDNTGSTYVSYQPADRGRYKGWVYYNAKRDSKQAYEKTFVLTEDLIIPSTEEVKTAYDNAIKKYGDKELWDSMTKFVIGDRVLNKDIDKAKKDYEKSKEWLEDYNNPNNNKYTMQFTEKGTARMYDKKSGKVIKDYGKLEYGEVMNAMDYKHALVFYDYLMNEYGANRITKFELGMGSLTASPKIKQEMIKELSSKGYNAMVDMAGAGSIPSSDKTYNREGVEPLIIFDRGKSLKEVKSKELKSGYEVTEDYQSSNRTLKRIRARDRI